MKLILTVLLIILNIQFLSAQKRVFLDENGSEIKERVFIKKWQNKQLLFSRWDYAGDDGKHFCKLKKDLYLIDTLNYLGVKNKLELILKKRINDSAIILIEYHYKDDFCSGSINNRWLKNEILKRKEFLEIQIEEMKNNNNIAFIALFETGIILQNNPTSKNEYFYFDADNFFRKKVFTNPTLCGSYALIKPNGQTLIRNGEFRPDWMANHLQSEYWNVFFNK